jgi:malonyl CoA-acyl carrier protein transacylase
MGPIVTEVEDVDELLSGLETSNRAVVGRSLYNANRQAAVTGTSIAI